MHTMRAMLDVERAATGTGQCVDVSYCCSVTILALAATIPRPAPDTKQGRFCPKACWKEISMIWIKWEEKCKNICRILNKINNKRNCQYFNMGKTSDGERSLELSLPCQAWPDTTSLAFQSRQEPSLMLSIHLPVCEQGRGHVCLMVSSLLASSLLKVFSILFVIIHIPNFKKFFALVYIFSFTATNY